MRLAKLGGLALALLHPLGAHASLQDFFAELFGRPDRPVLRASYEIRQFETREVKQTNDKLSLRQHSFNGSVPLNRLSDKRWRLLTEAKLDEVGSSARFPDGRGVPDKLWNLNAGFSHLRQLSEDRTIGGTFEAGSASDQPFGAFRDTIFQANAIYKVPAEGDATWIFILNWSNNRSFANYLPLPGAAYFFRPTESVRLALGLPFFMAFWSPFDKAVVNLTYFPLNSGTFRFSYFVFGPAQAYAQVKYQTKNYYLAERTKKRERLFYEEAVAEAGFSMPLERNLSVDANAGLSFDRKYFFGEETTDKRNGLLIRPDKAPFASVRLIATF